MISKIYKSKDSLTICCEGYPLSLHLRLTKLVYKTIGNTLLQKDQCVVENQPRFQGHLPLLLFDVGEEDPGKGLAIIEFDWLTELIKKTR